MTLCFKILAVVVCVLMTPTLSAQHVEIKINEEARRNIKFDFTPPMEELPDYKRPMEAPLEQDYMNYHVDLSIPRSLIDTFRLRRPTGYVRLEPYTIWTEFGEDPIYDVLFTGKDKRWEIHWSINVSGKRIDNYGREKRVSTGAFYDAATGSAGIGTTISLDFEKLLYETFTARGRAIRRNRKRAQAYKTYTAYVPTKDDTSKFPHFAIPKDSLTSPTTSNDASDQDDSRQKPRYRKPADIPKTSFDRRSREDSDEDYAKLIDERRRQDSIQRQDYFRKDKVERNVYDIERQIRKIEEKR